MSIRGVNYNVVAVPDNKLPVFYALGKMYRSLLDKSTDVILPVIFVFERC